MCGVRSIKNELCQGRRPHVRKEGREEGGKGADAKSCVNRIPRESLKKEGPCTRRPPASLTTTKYESVKYDACNMVMDGGEERSFRRGRR